VLVLLLVLASWLLLGRPACEEEEEPVERLEPLGLIILGVLLVDLLEEGLALAWPPLPLPSFSLLLLRLRGIALDKSRSGDFRTSDTIETAKEFLDASSI